MAEQITTLWAPIRSGPDLITTSIAFDSSRNLASRLKHVGYKEDLWQMTSTDFDSVFGPRNGPSASANLTSSSGLIVDVPDFLFIANKK